MLLNKAHIFLLLLMLVLQACGGANITEKQLGQSTVEDQELQSLMKAFGISPLQAPPKATDAKINLGKALFFDKILSGNRDISCATCHSPEHATSDGLSVAIGSGGMGVGPNRELNSGVFIARHSLDLFNRGFPEINTMFFDLRISGDAQSGFTSPAGEKLLPGLENVLAVQALFPVTDRSEMRGKKGENELAALDDNDFQGIWHGLMQRVLNIEAYQKLFMEAYPEIPLEKMDFSFAANAIAAFETNAFTLINSPWDQYVAGNTNAISNSAKRGGVLFFTKANCVTCHSGNLFSDQDIDNILVPQLGPGKNNAQHLDLGVGQMNGNVEDRFAFRSIPLRNIELTGPYMHNGAFKTLEAVIEHYNDPLNSFLHYDKSQLDVRLQATVQLSESLLSEMQTTFSDDLPNLNLTELEKSDLLAFLKALTDPAARNLSALRPSEVPSGIIPD